MTKTANHIANAETILSTLSPEAAAVLRSHFRTEIAQQLASSLEVAPKAKRPEGTAGVGRARAQFTNDGTNRSASQFIRDTDAVNPGISAKDIVAKGAEVGLSIEPSLVYNVRQIVRDKAEAAEATAVGAAVAKSEADKAAEAAANRAAGLEKARAAKAAKKAEAEAEANAKTAEKAKKKSEKAIVSAK